MDDTVRSLYGSSTKIPGVASPVIDSISMELNINQVPAATVTFHDADKVVKNAISPEVIEMLRDMQGILFSDRREEDVEFMMLDGKGGELNFKGFLTAPVSRVGFGQLNQQASSIAGDTFIDALDLSIYTIPPTLTTVTGESVKYREFKSLPSARDGDLPAHISALTKALVGNIQTTLSNLQGADKEAVQLKHDNNTKGDKTPLDTFLAILDNSDAIYDSWKETFKETSISSDITGRIIEILQSGSPGFWGVMRALMAEFRLIYIPSTDGTGKLVRADSVASGDTEDLGLEVTTESLGAGSKRILPLGGVVVRGMLIKEVTDGTGERKPQARYSVSAQYPSTIKAGWIHEMRAPVWLNTPVVKIYKSKSTQGEVEEKFQKDASRKDLSLDIGNYVSLIKDIAKKIQDSQDNIRGKILFEFAQLVYNELKLADSTATFTLPMDLTLIPGKRYKLTTKNTTIGEGFLSRVKHSLQVSAGKSVSAVTTLSLTHMDYGGLGDD